MSIHLRGKRNDSFTKLEVFNYLTNLGNVKACGHWKRFFKWQSVILAILFFNSILRNKMILTDKEEKISRVYPIIITVEYMSSYRKIQTLPFYI